MDGKVIPLRSFKNRESSNKKNNANDVMAENYEREKTLALVLQVAKSIKREKMDGKR